MLIRPSDSFCSLASAILAALLTTSATVAQPASSPWPMGGQNAQRTSSTSISAPSVKPDLLWKVNLGSSAYSQPSIGSDGTIYVATGNGQLHSVSPTGHLNWSFSGVGNSYASPAVAADGTVYYTAGRNVYALNPNGTQRWSFDSGVSFDGAFGYSPLITPSGQIDVSSWGGYYRLNPNGSVALSMGGSARAPSALASDGASLQNTPFGSSNLAIRRISSTGVQQWSTGVPGSTSGPVVAPDSTVLAMNYDGPLYAFNPASGARTTLNAEAINGLCQLAVGPDGSIYAGRDDRVQKFSSSGSLLWQATGTAGRSGAPTIAGNGIVLAADGQVGSSMRAFSDVNGAQLWSFAVQEPNYTFTSPILGSNAIYATTWSYGATDGYLYAVVPAPGVATALAPLLVVAFLRRRR